MQTKDTKFEETAIIIRQEEIADDIYSMWLRTEHIAAHAKAGQFVSVYCNEGSRLLPRPISICEIDRKDGAIRLVYRVANRSCLDSGMSFSCWKIFVTADRSILQRRMAVPEQREMYLMRYVRMDWMQTSFMPVDQPRCCVQPKNMPQSRTSSAGFPWKSAWHAVSEPVLPACASQKKKMHTAM